MGSMRMFVYTFLIAATMTAVSEGIRCYYKEDGVQYEGWVENSRWKYCFYDPDTNVFGGFGPDSDDIEKLEKMFDRVAFGKFSVYSDFYCFRENYNLNGAKDQISRCVCNSQSCNHPATLPSFIKPPVLIPDHSATVPLINEEQFNQILLKREERFIL